MALKYTPGLGLRITDEAEVKGLDEDQFADEEVGDAELFSMSRQISHGIAPSHTPTGTLTPTKESVEKQV